MTPKPLTLLLRAVLSTQYAGNQASLAESLDLNASHIGRMIRGDGGRLSVEACLRLSRQCDLDPDTVLAANGLEDIARQIRALYGKAAGVRNVLTSDERAWLAVFRSLSPEHRTALLGIAQALPR